LYVQLEYLDLEPQQQELYMELNPTQYLQMVADISQEEIPPGEDNVPEEEDRKEDNDSEDKNERDEE
jgi:hypothetical protein